jgi:hypothetical protein
MVGLPKRAPPSRFQVVDDDYWNAEHISLITKPFLTNGLTGLLDVANTPIPVLHCPIDDNTGLKNPKLSVNG